MLPGPVPECQRRAEDLNFGFPSLRHGQVARSAESAGLHECNSHIARFIIRNCGGNAAHELPARKNRKVPVCKLAQLPRLGWDTAV